MLLQTSTATKFCVKNWLPIAQCICAPAPHNNNNNNWFLQQKQNKKYRKCFNSTYPRIPCHIIKEGCHHCQFIRNINIVCLMRRSPHWLWSRAGIFTVQLHTLYRFHPPQSLCGVFFVVVAIETLVVIPMNLYKLLFMGLLNFKTNSMFFLRFWPTTKYSYLEYSNIFQKWIYGMQLLLLFLVQKCTKIIQFNHKKDG